MPQPFYSVIIPTYNCVPKLAASLDSVLAQTDAFYEIIICDGSSTDGTVEVIEEYHSRYSELIRYRSEPDNGVYDAMNWAIGQARGRYLYFLGAGDRLRPGVLSRVRQAAPEEGMALIYGNVHTSRGDSSHNGPYDMSRIAFNTPCHQAIFYERGIFDKLGLYDTKYSLQADWVMNMKCFGSDAVQKIYMDLTIADYEGGGLSEGFCDPAFLDDWDSLVVRYLGADRRGAALHKFEQLVARRIAQAPSGVARRWWHGQLWLLHNVARPLLPRDLRKYLGPV